MACKLKDFIDEANSRGIVLNEKKVKEAMLKGSNIKREDFEDMLPLDEKIMSLNNGEVIDYLYDLIDKDIASKQDPIFNEFLVGINDSIGAIEDFLYVLPSEQKIKVKTFSTKSSTFGEFEENTRGDNSISIASNQDSKASTEAEVLLHEMVHEVARGAFKLSPEVRSKARMLKDIVDSYEHDFTVFLSKVREPTELDIEDAKAKYDYVMNENSDLEEFIAYYISNPSMQFDVNAMINDFSIESESNKQSRFSIKKIDEKKKYTAEERKKIPSYVRAFKNIKYMLESSINENKKDNSIALLINSKENKISDTMKEDRYEAMNGVIESIIKFRAKMISKKRDTLVRDIMTIGEGRITGGFISKIIKSPKDSSIEFVENIIDEKFENYKKKKLIRGVYKNFKKIKEYSIDKSMSYSKKALKVMRRVKIIEKMINSELMIDLWRQFVSSESTGDNAIYYRMARRAEKIRDNIETLRSEAVKNIDFLKELDNSTSIQMNETMLKVFRGEMHSFIDFLMSGNVSKEILKQAFDTYQNKMKISDDKLSSLRDTVDFSMTGVVKSKKRLFVNAEQMFENIKEKNGKQDYIDSANEYMRLYAMTKLTSSDIDALNSSSKNENVVNGLKSVSNAHITLLSRLRKSHYMNGSFDTTPFGYIKNDKSSYANVMRFLPLNEAKSLLAKGTTVKIIKDSKTRMFNQEMVMVYSKDFSPAFSDGLLKVASEDIGGVSLLNTLKYAKRAKIGGLFISNTKMNRSKDEKSDIDVDDIFKLVVKYNSLSDSDKKVVKDTIGLDPNSLYPVHNSNGKIIDYKIVIKNEDKVIYQNQDMSAASRISDTIFSLADIRATRTHNQNVIDAVLEISDMSKDIENKENFVDIRKHENFSEKFEFKSYNEPIYIHRELIPLFLGSRQASLANLTVFGTGLNSKNVKSVIQMGESLISAVTSKYKQVIALITPEVVIGNMLSNSYVAREKGIDVEDFVVSFRDKWIQLNEINKMVDDFNVLNTRKISEPQNVTEINKELANLRYSIEQHPIFPLYNDGQMGLTMEDIDNSGKGVIKSSIDDFFYTKNDDEYQNLVIKEAYRIKGNSNRPIKVFVREAEKNIKKKRLHVPLLVKNIAKIAYVDSDTFVAKKAKKLLMYGDAITKEIILDKYRKDYFAKTGKTMPKNVEMKKLDEVAELFVSYSTQETGVQKWIENVGMVTFMKYQFRAMKGYYKHMVKNKARSAFGQIGQLLFDVNIPDPLDSNLKYGPFESLSNKTKIGEIDEVIASNMSPHFLGAIGF